MTVSLRPQRMSEMVGQREVFERLEIAVQAARQREEPLGHVLFGRSARIRENYLLPLVSRTS